MRFSNAWAAASISGELCCVVVIPFIPLRAALNSGPRRISELDLLAKNQGHIASGVLQQLLARNTGLGAKLQTLHQVNERTASHLGRGCASQAPRLHLLLETFRENISGCGEALRTYERISVTRSDCPSAAAGAPIRRLPQPLLGGSCAAYLSAHAWSGHEQNP